jgi:hypothetical protein
MKPVQFNVYRNYNSNHFLIFFLADELDKVWSFEGHPEDHLSLLRLTKDGVVVGARDALYNFSNTDLTKYSVSMVLSLIR